MTHLAQSFYNWYRTTLRNTKYRWLIVLATLAYLIIPFDFAPDFIPVIGWIDDGIVATLLVTELSQLFLEFLKTRTTRTNDGAIASDPVVVDVTE